MHGLQGDKEMYKDLTINSSSRIKRFSHKRRFDVALALLHICDNDSVLDYGAGDGYFLNILVSQNKEIRVTGYEPVKDMYDELSNELRDGLKRKDFMIANNLGELPFSPFNKICCFEVLEHLTEQNQTYALLKMKNLLVERKIGGGVILISVPIELGISSLFKNIVRLLMRKAHPNTNIATIVKSVFGLKIDRPDQQYISSHIGFDYRQLEATIIRNGLVIKKKYYSPFNIFRSLFNSQVFYLVEK